MKPSDSAHRADKAVFFEGGNMKNYIRVLGQIFGRPWAITQGGLQTVIASAERRGDIEAVLASRSEKLTNTQHVEMIKHEGSSGAIAVIQVSGPIFRYANIFTEISGATSIEIFAQDFRAALENKDVSTIVLNIDSPGGQVTGVNEMAQMIFEAREIKPVIAYVGGLGASAAYWLASAASEIVIDSTAQLGSIGVVIGFRKSSEDDSTIEIVSTASPKKRIDPETDKGRAQVLEMADALADVFIDTVAQNRGVSAQTVRNDFGQGGMLVGQAAVKAGLADRLGSLEEIISSKASLSSGTDAMAGINDNQLTTGGSADMKITVEMIKGEHPQVAEALKLEGKKEGSAAELTRIKGIQALSIPGHEKLIAEMAYDGATSPEAAALKIMQVEAEARNKHSKDLNADASLIPNIDTGSGDDAGEAAEMAAAAKGIAAGAV